MTLINPPSLVFVGVAVLAALLVGKFSRASLTVVDAVILPVGVVGALLGFVYMLQNMSDPAALGPGLAVAMLTAVYAAIIKLGLDIFGWVGTAGLEEPQGMSGFAGALLFVLVFVGITLEAGGLTVLINVEAIGLFALSGALIAGLTRASGSEAYVDRLARYLPYAGLVIFLGACVALLPVMNDPTLIGPYIAVGLLGQLYTVVVSITLKLAFPDLVSAESPTSQWLYWGVSLSGIVAILVILIVLLKYV